MRTQLRLAFEAFDSYTQKLLNISPKSLDNQLARLKLVQECLSVVNEQAKYLSEDSSFFYPAEPNGPVALSKRLKDNDASSGIIFNRKTETNVESVKRFEDIQQVLARNQDAFKRRIFEMVAEQINDINDDISIDPLTKISKIKTHLASIEKDVILDEKTRLMINTTLAHLSEEVKVNALKKFADTYNDPKVDPVSKQKRIHFYIADLRELLDAETIKQLLQDENFQHISHEFNAAVLIRLDVIIQTDITDKEKLLRIKAFMDEINDYAKFSPATIEKITKYKEMLTKSLSVNTQQKIELILSTKLTAYKQYQKIYAEYSDIEKLLDDPTKEHIKKQLVELKATALKEILIKIQSLTSTRENPYERLIAIMETIQQAFLPLGGELSKEIIAQVSAAQEDLTTALHSPKYADQINEFTDKMIQDIETSILTPAQKLEKINLIISIIVQAGGNAPSRAATAKQEIIKQQAAQIVYTSRVRFSELNVKELLNPNEFTNPKESPTLCAFAAHLDNLRRMVNNSLLSSPDIHQAIAALKDWITIAELCREQYDYHSFYAIAAAIKSSSASYLLDLNVISADEKKILETLTDWITPSESYIYMRSLFKAGSQQPGFIPFSTIITQDMTFLKDGNPSKELFLAAAQKTIDQFEPWQNTTRTILKNLPSMPLLAESERFTENYYHQAMKSMKSMKAANKAISETASTLSSSVTEVHVETVANTSKQIKDMAKERRIENIMSIVLMRTAFYTFLFADEKKVDQFLDIYLPDSKTIVKKQILDFRANAAVISELIIAAEAKNNERVKALLYSNEALFAFVSHKDIKGAGDSWDGQQRLIDNLAKLDALYQSIAKDNEATKKITEDQKKTAKSYYDEIMRLNTMLRSPVDMQLKFSLAKKQYAQISGTVPFTGEAQLTEMTSKIALTKTVARTEIHAPQSAPTMPLHFTTLPVNKTSVLITQKHDQLKIAMTEVNYDDFMYELGRILDPNLKQAYKDYFEKELLIPHKAWTKDLLKAVIKAINTAKIYDLERASEKTVTEVLNAAVSNALGKDFEHLARDLLLPADWLKAYKVSELPQPSFEVPPLPAPLAPIIEPVEKPAEELTDQEKWSALVKDIEKTAEDLNGFPTEQDLRRCEAHLQELKELHKKLTSVGTIDQEVKLQKLNETISQIREMQSWHRSVAQISGYHEMPAMRVRLLQQFVDGCYHHLYNLETIAKKYPQHITPEIHQQLDEARNKSKIFLQDAAKQGLYALDISAYQDTRKQAIDRGGRIGSRFHYLDKETGIDIYIKQDDQDIRQCSEVHRGAMMKAALDALSNIDPNYAQYNLVSPDIVFVKRIDPVTDKPIVMIGSRILPNSISLYQHVTGDDTAERDLLFTAFRDDPELLENYPGLQIILALSMTLANFDLHEANLRPLLDANGKIIGMGIIDFGVGFNQPESDIHPHSHTRHIPGFGPRNFFRFLFPRSYRTSDKMANAWMLCADERIQEALRKGNASGIQKIVDAYGEGSEQFIAYAKDLGMKNANHLTNRQQVIEFFEKNFIEKRAKSAEIIGLNLKIEQCIVKNKEGKFRLTDDIDKLILKYPEHFKAGKYRFRKSEHDGLWTKYKLTNKINQRAKVVFSLQKLFKEIQEPLQSVMIKYLTKSVYNGYKTSEFRANINAFAKEFQAEIFKGQRISMQEFGGNINRFITLSEKHQLLKITNPSAADIRKMFIQYNLSLPSRDLPALISNYTEDLTRLEQTSASLMAQSLNDEMVSHYKDLITLHEKLTKQLLLLRRLKEELGGDDKSILRELSPAIRSQREKEISDIEKQILTDTVQLAKVDALRITITHKADEQLLSKISAEQDTHKRQLMIAQAISLPMAETQPKPIHIASDSEKLQPLLVGAPKITQNKPTS